MSNNGLLFYHSIKFCLLEFLLQDSASLQTNTFCHNGTIQFATLKIVYEKRILAGPMGQLSGSTMAKASDSLS
jgi:hypothetical protein